MIKDIPLLFETHSSRILMAVTMKTNLMTTITDHSTFFWERFEAVSWYKPCGFLVELLKQLQQPAYTCASSKKTTTYVTCAIFAFVRAKPARDSVDIHAVANEDSFLSHIDDFDSGGRTGSWE
jgi:hypothetical protein